MPVNIALFPFLTAFMLKGDGHSKRKVNITPKYWSVAYSPHCFFLVTCWCVCAALPGHVHVEQTNGVNITPKYISLLLE